MARIKKWLMIVLCAVFLSGMTVQAEENTEFHVENPSGKAGDIVTVPVEFNTGQEVGGFQISIYYDSEVMEFQSLEKGDLIIEEGQGIFDYNHIPESSEIIVVYVVADTVKDEGVIVNLQFKLKQDCGEQLPVGVGIDEIVDNSEANNPVTGEVSGVDEAFQAKVMEQTGGSTVVAAGNGESKTGETDSQTEESDEQNSAEAGDGEDTDLNTPEIEKNETADDQSGAEQEEGMSGTWILAGVIVAAVVVVAGAAFYVVRKRKK